MKAKRRNDRVVLKSKGSAKKRRSSNRTEVLDGREWTVGSIAWNRDGNIVFLDPRVAKFVRDHARSDGEFEVGIPDVPVQVSDGGARTADTTAPSTPIITVTPPTPLTLCGCGALRFLLDRESAARTRLLSSERMRAGM